MSRWLTSLASGEGAAALSSLVKQAVSTVESSIDKALDIQADPSGRTNQKSDAGVAPSFSDFLDFGAGIMSSASEPLRNSNNSGSAGAALDQKHAHHKQQQQLQPSVEAEEPFFDMLSGGGKAPKASPKPVTSSPSRPTSVVSRSSTSSPTKETTNFMDLLSIDNTAATSATPSTSASAAKTPRKTSSPPKWSGIDMLLENLPDASPSTTTVKEAQTPESATESQAGLETKAAVPSAPIPSPPAPSQANANAHPSEKDELQLPKHHQETRNAPKDGTDALGDHRHAYTTKPQQQDSGDSGNNQEEDDIQVEDVELQPPAQVEAAEKRTEILTATDHVDSKTSELAHHEVEQQELVHESNPNPFAKSPEPDTCHVEVPPEGAAVSAETVFPPDLPVDGDAAIQDSAEVHVIESTKDHSSVRARSPSPTHTHAPEPTHALASPDKNRLKAILEQREQQLIDASKQNVALNDQAAQLQTALAEARRERSDTVTSLETHISQLQQRIKELDDQLKVSQAERKQARQAMAGDAAMQSRVNDLARVLTEKEQSIKGLLEEGENLAKQILKANNTIKKLRAKETDTDKELKDTQQRLESTMAELTQCKNKLTHLTQVERDLAVNNQEITEHSDAQLRQIIKLEKELASSHEKATELQSLFEQTSRQLEESRRLEAEARTAAQTEARERELQTHEEISQQLEQVRKQAEVTETALRKEVFELRASLVRAEDETAWREDNHRREIQAMQARLQAAEARNEDVSVLGQDSTRPLLRQIELLQSQHANILRDWKQVEQTLSQRLQDAEQERAEAVESERALKERLIEFGARMASLEAQNARERQDKSRLAVELEAERARVSELDARISDMSARLERAAADQAAEIQIVRRECEQRADKRVKEEADKWGSLLESEQRQRQSLVQTNAQLERRASAARLSVTSAGSDDGSPSAGSPSTAAPVATSAASAAMRFPPGTSGLVAIERLQATIKRGEGQIASMQLQLQMAVQARDEMAEELVRATNESEMLRAKADRTDGAASQLAELEMRYNAALEMLGEKTERVMELEADVADMRTAFRAQVEELMAERAAS